MALPTDYSTLQTEIAGWLDRTDLTSYITTFIGMAEAEFNRVIWTPETEAVTTLTAAAETVSLPANFRMARALFISADPKVNLEQMSLNELRYRYSAAATGQPSNYAIQSGNTLVLGPSPDASYSVVLNYYQKIPALTVSATTNWLLTAHPDIYIYGTLLRAEAFLANDPRIAVWGNLYGQALAQLEQMGLKKNNGGAPQRIRSAYVV